MIRIALSAVALLALTACSSTRPYGPYDTRLAGSPPAYVEAPRSVVVDAAPMPLDPMPLPADVAPGECVMRAPDGDYYRWVRTTCAGDGASYAYRTYDYGHDQDYSYSYDYSSAPQSAVIYEQRYHTYGYTAAGRDAQGYLVWPGKTPAY